MKAQHTPGPWSVSKLATPDYAPEFAIHGRLTRWFDLARTMNGNSEANARLIAAAPELLAALDLVLARLEVAADDAEELGYDQRAENIREDIITARAAIAKAGG